MLGGVLLSTLLLAAACGNATAPRSSGLASGSHTHQSTTTAPTSTTTTTTTIPCPSETGGTVPISEVCSSSGAPHFDTPAAAMQYLAQAWNSGNVQEVDYVTDPAGRSQMNSMASAMVNLQFDNCSANLTGDYTCFFTHDIAPTTSSTTYPNPNNYPPGEAVFTVGPASGPGWYLTYVEHCG
jgi:hypothetical protein